VITKGCINLRSCLIDRDLQVKRRFRIHSAIEDRTFIFECILDMDFIPWFTSIQNNITVSL
jgi:singapore isolate B (sub-type 7) whole genome shotgun sequence assembly, scaffold_5